MDYSASEDLLDTNFMFYFDSEAADRRCFVKEMLKDVFKNQPNINDGAFCENR